MRLRCRAEIRGSGERDEEAFWIGATSAFHPLALYFLAPFGAVIPLLLAHLGYALWHSLAVYGAGSRRAAHLRYAPEEPVGCRWIVGFRNVVVDVLEVPVRACGE